MLNLHKEVQYKNPNKVYKDKQGKARNLKKVQNIKYFANKNKRIHLDEVCATQSLSRDIDFVYSIATSPNLVVLAFDQHLSDEINNMMTVSNSTVMCCYDTTFNIGDFFMVVLQYKYTLSQKPVIPVFYMFHDKKFETIHEKNPCFRDKLLKTILMK